MRFVYGGSGYTSKDGSRHGKYWKLSLGIMYSPSKYSRVSSNLSVGSQASRQPASKGKRVQVWTRIRPTSQFAQDNLELLPDGKGVVNNQIADWSFRLDGIFHNSNQDQAQ
ncbi:KIF9-like protein [Mya arenaria]|uniref:KIF9-like protein n=1 Tax=Mya arenaria TaxID=6604 RepID=A0ABY7EQL5_MYAAR|nr:KIF9-like protein [Mya arenaria]